MLVDCKWKILIVFIALLVSRNIYSQPSNFIVSRTDTFLINSNNKYFLSSPFALSKSLKVFVDSKLLTSEQFIYNQANNYISLSPSLKIHLTDTLIVKYRVVKLRLNNVYRHNSMVEYYLPNKIRGNVLFKSKKENITVNTIFGSSIKRSGTILRGFSIGSNKDLKINSGLRLQLSGKLSKDVSIVAALTDENTPIQPEGNTERLNELDKVFIQIKHPFGDGVFGDFDLKIHNGTFYNIERKLQGAIGTVKYNNNFAQFTFASSRGKFTTNKITGIDGVQGPYRLRGKNNEPDIVIIAGSEKVYVDGILMKRGENNDYTIEYSNASITFMPKRVITSASRITVDFEYTDRKYKREFWGFNSGLNLLKNKLKIGLSLFNEGDSKNNPIDVILNDKEKKIISRAGDNPIKAAISGVSFAKDSASKGLYVKNDTLIDGREFSYYRYEPGSPFALYNVKFSFVGNGKGDYKQISIGNYKFVGKGNGNYLPIIFLPLPANKKNANVVFNYSSFNKLKINLELSGSLFDKNTFSPLDDSDNSGLANKFNVKLEPTKIKLAGTSLGEIGFSLSNRFVDVNYSALDRFNPIEFNRDYNLPVNIGGNQSLLSARLNYLPLRNIKINASYNRLKAGEDFQALRFVQNTTAENFHNISLNYHFDLVKSRRELFETNWLRENGTVSYLMGKFVPGLYYLFENKREKISSDSLLNSSYKYLEIAPFFQIFNYNGLSLDAKYSYREESFPLNGVLLRQSKATMYTYSVKYYGLRGINTSLDLIIRNKEFSKEFKLSNNLNTKTILIRFNNRFNLFNRFFRGNFYYQTATERTAKLQKVFVRVPEGNGNYIYLGDLNNNGIADESEFEQTIYNGNYILTLLPTNELFPTIGVKTNARFYFNFNKIIKANNFFSNILKAISTETFYRIEERSKESNLDKIYLLNLNYFLNDSTTINGIQFFQNDFYLYKNNSKFSIRYRYEQRKSLNQYSSGIVRTYFRENSLRIRWLMVRGIRNQTDYLFQANNRISPAAFNRTFALDIQKIKTEIFYYPYSNLQVSFSVEAMRAKNNYPPKPVVIDENSEGINVVYYLGGKGRLSIRLERKEFSGASESKYLPFEITEGNVLGKNYLLNVNLDYRIANNLRITFNYLGRKKNREKIIHYLRAEARAFF